MATDDLAVLDATAQAELVRTKQASPAELVDAAIARIEALNPALNAVIHERFDKAREARAARCPTVRSGAYRCCSRTSCARSRAIRTTRVRTC